MTLAGNPGQTFLADECRRVYQDAAHVLGTDLAGGGILDLMADNIDHARLVDLKGALVISGIAAIASARIKAQILRYAEEGRRS